MPGLPWTWFSWAHHVSPIQAQAALSFLWYCFYSNASHAYSHTHASMTCKQKSVHPLSLFPDNKMHQVLVSLVDVVTINLFISHNRRWLSFHIVCMKCDSPWFYTSLSLITSWMPNCKWSLQPLQLSDKSSSHFSNLTKNCISYLSGQPVKTSSIHSWILVKDVWSFKFGHVRNMRTSKFNLVT